MRLEWCNGFGVGRGHGAASAAGVICFFIHYLHLSKLDLRPMGRSECSLRESLSLSFAPTSQAVVVGVTSDPRMCVTKVACVSPSLFHTELSSSGH